MLGDPKKVPSSPEELFKLPGDTDALDGLDLDAIMDEVDRLRAEGHNI
jgi:hypothetical protein